MTAWDWISNALLSLVPPVLVGLVFWVVMRSILRADSKERAVYAEIEAELRAKREAEGAKPAAKNSKKDA
jgi:flagellar biosynthesis/type III secretory pathway M-ring protein FliF/YscJ